MSVVRIACVAGVFIGEFFSVYPVCVRETPAREVKLENEGYQWRRLSFRPRFSFRAAVSLTLGTGFKTNPVRTTNKKRIKKILHQRRLLSAMTGSVSGLN